MLRSSGKMLGPPRGGGIFTAGTKAAVGPMPAPSTNQGGGSGDGTQRLTPGTCRGRTPLSLLSVPDESGVAPATLGKSMFLRKLNMESPCTRPLLSWTIIPEKGTLMVTPKTCPQTSICPYY